MMVIRGTLGGTANTILPADRCSWIQAVDTNGGYNVGTVLFYDGVVAGASVTAANLGFIGKSGRFVAIA